MNKRSAILMALALTGALTAGGIALATGVGGPAASEASTTRSAATRAEPIVRTTTRTVTIHRAADRSAAGVVVLGTGSTGTGASVHPASGSSGDDGVDAEHETEHETEGPDDDGDNSGSGSENSGPGSTDPSGHSGEGGDD